MRRNFVYILLGIILLGVCAYFAYQFVDEYWIHRYDDLIERQAKIYRIEKKLVWSVIHEETYFSAWQIGKDSEIGLMQVTPTVAKEWAKETGFKEFEKSTSDNVEEFMKDPERNIQVGCWYLEKLRENYRDYPAETAMMLAAYNAGASRVEEWTKGVDASNLPEGEFVKRISIPSTRAYVTSILQRFRTKE